MNAAPRLRERPLAHEIADAMRDETRQMRLDAVDGMAGQIQAERLAFARQALSVAPVRLGRGIAPRGARRARSSAARPKRSTCPASWARAF